MRLGICCLLAAFHSSCSMFGAGTHVYCETITVPFPSDSIIQRLAELKSSGRFDDARSFPDGLHGEQWVMHNFYFYDHAHQFLLRLEAPPHTRTTTEIHLAGMKDFTANPEWVGFADASAARKKEVYRWFDQVIRPILGKEALPQ